eukprot:258980_1
MYCDNGYTQNCTISNNNCAGYPTCDNVVITGTDNPTTTGTSSPTRYTSAPTIHSTTKYPTHILATDDVNNLYLININVTIHDINITFDDVKSSVNRSVNAYDYFKRLEANADYQLTSEEINSEFEIDARKIIFDLIVFQENIDINPDELEISIQQDMDDEYGDNKVIVYVVIKNTNDSKLIHKQSFFHEITIIIAAVFVIIIIISYIYSTYIHHNDFYNIGSLFSAATHILDTFSDLFFALQITYTPQFESSQLLIIFILSIISIVIPTFITLLQLDRTIHKHWMKNDEIRSWLSNYLYLLFLISILCGSSFAAIKLCRSNLFNLLVFSIPLNKKAALYFQTNKLYSTIFFQNIPQLVLAVWYVQVLNEMPNPIVYISMTFSTISIITTIISMQTAKKLVYSQDYSSIEFEVTGSMIGANIKRCRNNVRKIRYEIGIILGLHENLVEIMRPKQIPGGVKIYANIYINNAKAIDLNCKQLIIDANNSGDLVNMVMNSWRLSGVPVISNIKYDRHASQKREDNVVNIAVKSSENIMMSVITNDN